MNFKNKSNNQIIISHLSKDLACLKAFKAQG